MSETPSPHGAAESPCDVFDLEQLRQLIELMEQHDLSEVNLRAGSQRIRLRRGTPSLPSMPLLPAAPPGPSPPAAPPTAGTPQETAPAADEAHIEYIKSPMVGTFYSRPNPDADPFVKVGDVVEPESTVCIIEAMKVFNEIPAELRGKIVAVLVQDEEPVEFGKPLFKVDTSSS